MSKKSVIGAVGAVGMFSAIAGYVTMQQQAEMPETEFAEAILNMSDTCQNDLILGYAKVTKSATENTEKCLIELGEALMDKPIIGENPNVQEEVDACLASIQEQFPNVTASIEPTDTGFDFKAENNEGPELISVFFKRATADDYTLTAYDVEGAFGMGLGDVGKAATTCFAEQIMRHGFEG